MPVSWEALSSILFCPNDKQSLHFLGDGYFCRSCSRRFPVLFERIVDLRPQSPLPLPSGTNSEFAADYIESFHDPSPCPWNDNALGFGATEVISPRDVRRKKRQVLHIQSVLREKGKTAHVFCDFSAGAGYYTLECARSFPLVLHCDLSCDSLMYASRKAEKLGIDNIAFLRIDYLQPPFFESLDSIICMDSLERGEGHEKMLLTALRRSLRRTGIALVDFHNWWHNPLRRLGLLPENYRCNRSYGRREAEALVRSCGIRTPQYLPFYQEFEPTGLQAQLCKPFLPATRHVFLLKLSET